MPNTRLWTDEQLMDALRAAADAKGQPLRVEAYNAWRAEDRAHRPGYHQLSQHLGPWTVALAAAGLDVDRRRAVFRLPSDLPNSQLMSGGRR